MLSNPLREPGMAKVGPASGSEGFHLPACATSLFKNHARDQFGTLVALKGDATGATTSDLFVIGVRRLR